MSRETRVAPDFKLPLASGSEFHLYGVLESGPVILNFIMGTWCPLCTRHLENVRKWQLKLEKKRLTVLIVSCQPVESIRKWLKDNPSPFLFASDVECAVVKQFDLVLPLMGIPRPATLLIDSDRTVRLSYVGPRGEKLRTQVEQTVSAISGAAGD